MPFAEKTIPKHEAIARIAEDAPGLILVVAPAGYGKTTLAQQIANGYERRSQCDCSAADALVLSKRVVSTLIEEDPHGRAALSQTALGLAKDDVHGWQDLALRAWSARGDHAAAFIFENAESLHASPPALRLLGLFATTIPENRRVVVCTRRHISLPPTTRRGLCVITASDLSFSREEMSSVFSSEIGAAELARVEAIAQGWPIAVMLFARLESEGRLETVIGELDSTAFEDLYAYLAESVIDGLARQELASLVAAAAIPRARRADVEAACMDAEAGKQIEHLSEMLPFVHAEADGSFSVHPFLMNAIRLNHRSESRRCVERAACAAQASGELYRAAELYLAIGETSRALDAVEGQVISYFGDTPSEFVDIVTRIDDAILVRYPATYSAAFLFRLYFLAPDVILARTRSVYDALGSEVSPLFKSGILSSLINCYYNIGDLNQARRELNAFEASLTSESSSPERVLPLLWHWALDCYEGKFGLWEANQARGEATFPPGTFGVMLRDFTARMHRARGEVQSEWKTLERAIALVEGSGLLVYVAVVLVELIFAAWLYDKPVAFDHYLGRLEREVAPSMPRGVQHLIDCARGRGSQAVEGYEQLQARCYGYLIAISLSDDLLERKRLAAASLVAARASHQKLYTIFALCAYAEFAEGERDALLAEAQSVAAAVESPALQEAVAAWRAGAPNVGMLEPLAARMRSTPTHPREKVHIELLTGNVAYIGRPANTTPKEALALFALASKERPFSAIELASMLWPEQSSEAGVNSLRVMVSRVRSKFPGLDVIASTEQGYRLGSDTVVDVVGVERALDAFRRGHPTEPQHATLVRAFEAMSAGRPTTLVSQPWFAPLEAHFELAEREIAALLTEEALRAGDATRAYHIASEMLLRDGCDESACGLAIRALRSLGRHSAAATLYDRFCRELAAELDAEPSLELRTLVST